MKSYRQTHRKLYEVWHAMKQRCDNVNHPHYQVYGGRGISYYPEWKQAEKFCEWALDNGYKEGLEIDRIDVNGNYEPTNCRWVNRKTNAQNQRKTIWLTVDGETKCVAEWERVLGLNKSVVSAWVRRWGKEFAERRIQEVLETGTFKKYRPKQLKKELAIEIVKEGLME